MRFVDLNGREYNKSIDKYKYGKKKTSRSKGQAKLGEAIQELFPSHTILEEFPCFGTRLKLDYFLPSAGIAFEFDGRQHNEYNGFFHKGQRINFAKSQLNDVKKNTWCDVNEIILIRITESEIENLQAIIYERTRNK